MNPCPCCYDLDEGGYSDLCDTCYNAAITGTNHECERPK